MENFLHTMIEKRQLGIRCGIPSFCCANKIVIEAILDYAKANDIIVLIEATSNQVNQDLGYTGMTPLDFKDYVFEIADKIDLSKNKIILGGDHMGPLPWIHLPAEIAMDQAEILVRDCVRAGYTKIHLDTSMPLQGDVSFSDELIAQRAGRLYIACEDEFSQIKKSNKSAIHPVYVIGSEVPIPGGAISEEGEVEITNCTSFQQSLFAYKKVFTEMDITDAWQHIIALVVQPGVEFGNDSVQDYDRDSAKELCDILHNYPDIVFEGHSTDFQTSKNLRYLVEDGFGIIKVGPALTFALREALFALDYIENELDFTSDKKANFSKTLIETMCTEPKYWNKYYDDTKSKILQCKYSFSDRSRYYLIDQKVEHSVSTLISNLSNIELPLGLLSQFMPLQYKKVIEGTIDRNAYSLVKDSVTNVIEDYHKATQSIYLKK
ncbi:MAG: class II D-tagatose-bisphosphate aldolase, non-catalytic subunit [Eubacteriales bacterium]